MAFNVAAKTAAKIINYKMMKKLAYIITLVVCKV